MDEILNIIRQPTVFKQEDFEKRANQPNIRSSIASYTVPRTTMLETANRFLRMKLMTRHIHTFTAPTTPVDETITLPTEIARDVAVNLKGENVNVVRVEPTPDIVLLTANYTVTEPKTIVIPAAQIAANVSNTFEIYYLSSVGGVSITAHSPGVSNEGVIKRLLEDSLATVNMVNLNDTRTALKYGLEESLELPELWTINVNVISPTPIILYGEEKTAFTSPHAIRSFFSLPFDVSNMDMWPLGIERAIKSRAAE